MLSDTFRIVIRDHYISRLWSWMAGYGILLAAVGIILLMERMGTPNPFRDILSPNFIYWSSIGAYAGSLVSVAISFLVNLKMKPEKLALAADKASRNPGLPFEADGLPEPALVEVPVDSITLKRIYSEMHLPVEIYSKR